MLRFFKQYYPIRNILFVVGEGLFIYVSFLLASWIILGADTVYFGNWIFLKVFLITIICQLCLYYNDLYDLKHLAKFNELAWRLVQAVGYTAILIALVYFIFPGAIIGKGVFVLSIFLLFYSSYSGVFVTQSS